MDSLGELHHRTNRDRRPQNWRIYSGRAPAAAQAGVAYSEARAGMKAPCDRMAGTAQWSSAPKYGVIYHCTSKAHCSGVSCLWLRRSGCWQPFPC